MPSVHLGPAHVAAGRLVRAFLRVARLRWVEQGLVATGVTLLVLAGGTRLTGEIQRQTDLKRFGQATRSASVPSVAGDAVGHVDTSLWSPERLRAWEESLRKDFRAPLAVLAIPKIGLEVPVLEGTDDLTLNRGVGLITGSPSPGEDGNAGIAGHRDGYFRGLKDVGIGDEIELRTLTASRAFVIDSIRIVSPEDVWVLDPTPFPVLTLVTCYPFYFIGDAPQRYIVRAVRRETATPR